MNFKHADVRFNGGHGALLCNRCSIILDYGFMHEDKKHYCAKCRAIRQSTKDKKKKNKNDTKRASNR